MLNQHNPTKRSCSKRLDAIKVIQTRSILEHMTHDSQSHSSRILQPNTSSKLCLPQSFLHPFPCSVKLKFHWDQFPRNLPVANVTGKSPTSYEEVERVGRVASLLRGSWRRRQQVREEVTGKLVPAEVELKSAKLLFSWNIIIRYL